MLIERERELEQADGALRDVLAGYGTVLLIEGPAGIGKTSLLQAVSARAAGLGFETLSARSGALERELPFGLVRSLLGDIVGDVRAGPQSGRAALAAAALSANPEDRALELHAVIDGIHWLVRDRAASRPVLLAVDDVQWSDPESTKVLAYLCRRIDGASVGVAATVRTGESEPVAEILGALESAERCLRLRPRPLTAAAAEIIVHEQRGQSVEAAVCAELHRASGGNPLYLRALARGDSTEAPAGTDGLEIIARSVFGRVRRERAEVLDLARAVAVLGVDVELADAATLAGLDLNTAAAAAHRLVELDILCGDARLSFTHPVVRAVIYDELGSTRRGVAHLAAARMLAAAGAPSERVAAQIAQAPRSSEAWVVDVLRDAARNAAARAAHTQSVSYLRRALEEARPRAPTQLLTELATAEFRDGRAEAITHLREAVHQMDGPDRADGQLRLAAYLVAAERESEALDALDDALLDAPSEQRLRIIAHAAVIALTGVAEQAAARRDALECASADVGDAGIPFNTALAICRFAQNDRSGIDQLERDMAAVAAGRSPSLELWYYAAWALTACERESTVAQFAQLVHDRSVARGSTTGLAMAHSALAQASLRRGEVLLAEEHGQAALEAARHGVARQYIQLACGATLAALTELAASDAELAGVLALVDDETPTFPHALPLWSRARVRLARGDVEGAIADLRGCGDRCLPFGITEPAWIPWRSDLGLALQRSSAGTEEPLALVDSELRLAREAGSARATGIALRARGLLVGGGSGIDHLSEAAEILAGTPDRLERARALVDLGASLRRQRARQQARPPLRDALELSLSLGARALAQRARDELAATGARPRTGYRRGVHSLTASERRVARLAASGRTNREIAEELYVSMKTVESHLRSVYSKLDITGRGHLAASLDRSSSEEPALPSRRG